MHICTYDYRTAEIVVIIFASNANKSIGPPTQPYVKSR